MSGLRSSSCELIPLDFLGEGEFEAEIFQDVAADRPMELKIVRKTVTSQSEILVRMVSGGGVVARMRKIEGKRGRE